MRGWVSQGARGPGGQGAKGPRGQALVKVIFGIEGPESWNTGGHGASWNETEGKGTQVLGLFGWAEDNQYLHRKEWQVALSS